MSDLPRPLPVSSPSFATGLNWLDAHHQFFFDEFERLAAAIRAGRGAERLAASVDSLGRYAVFHFGAEERWMTDVAYPKEDLHRQEHVSFLEAKRAIEQRLALEGPSERLAEEVLLWIQTWLLEHIEAFDRDVVRFVEEGAPTDAVEKG